MFNVFVCVGGWVYGAGGGGGGGGGSRSGGDLRPPSYVICIRAMSCSKARSSQIALAIRV